MEAPHRPGSLFQNRSFAVFWSSQSISFLGTQITYVALPLTAVAVLHASAMEAGLLSALETLPFLLFGLFVGILVDRRARRPILITANAIRFAALAWIPVAYSFGVLTVPQLLAVTFLVGVMTVFFEIAYMSYLPGLVGYERLMEANGKLQASASTAEVAGPGIAGGLIGLMSAPLVIAIDALSYLISAVALIRLPADTAPQAEERPEGKQSIRASLREGFAVVGRSPLLRWCTVAVFFLSLFFSSVMAVYFLYLVREVGLASTAVGLIVAAGSIGGLVGALLSGRLNARLGIGPTLVAAVALPGVGFLLLATVDGDSLGSAALAAVATFIGFFGIPVWDVTVISFRQSITPEPLQGRVNATVRSLSWGTLSLGSLMGGALASAWGLRETVVISAVGLFVPALVVLLSPVRAMRHLPEQVNEPVQPTPVSSS
ncbi:MFS transporter [Streptomyces sp. ICBB 8177]|uniref:MFS transporter n=1 Tax=Streptomyces sp. ICBB 8177 TaxID=563922 RepID=UPI000D676E68|nr:MFS transporter [Streptomyces sp. ICBB 8177]PWI45000.1 MFS transporter [Streptomyces sp. ICBB 8177]